MINGLNTEVLLKRLKQNKEIKLKKSKHLLFSKIEQELREFDKTDIAKKQDQI